MLKNIPSAKKSAYSGDIKHHLCTDFLVLLKAKQSGLWTNMYWSTPLGVSKTKTGFKKISLQAFSQDHRKIQAGRDLRMPLIQPPAQSRVSSELRPFF